MDAKTHWIVVADKPRALLFACIPQARGGFHLEQRRFIDNADDTAVWGATAAGRSFITHRDLGQSDKEPRDSGATADSDTGRFARSVRRWFEHASRDLGVIPDHVTILATPGMASALREYIRGVSIRTSEVSTLDAAELDGNPDILDAIHDQP